MANDEQEAEAPAPAAPDTSDRPRDPADPESYAAAVPVEEDGGEGTQLVHRSVFVGPLPDPATLRGYDDVVADGAERIVARWEEESKHRHKIESRESRSEAFQRYAGPVFAFIIVLTALYLGYDLVRGGHGAIGIATILTALAGIVSIFITGALTNGRETGAGSVDADAET